MYTYILYEWLFCFLSSGLIYSTLCCSIFSKITFFFFPLKTSFFLKLLFQQGSLHRQLLLTPRSSVNSHPLFSKSWDLGNETLVLYFTWKILFHSLNPGLYNTFGSQQEAHKPTLVQWFSSHQAPDLKQIKLSNTDIPLQSSTRVMHIKQKVCPQDFSSTIFQVDRLTRSEKWDIWRSIF